MGQESCPLALAEFATQWTRALRPHQNQLLLIGKRLYKLISLTLKNIGKVASVNNFIDLELAANK